jgi:hypothetical protein
MFQAKSELEQQGNKLKNLAIKYTKDKELWEHGLNTKLEEERARFVPNSIIFQSVQATCFSNHFLG